MHGGKSSRGEAGGMGGKGGYGYGWQGKVWVAREGTDSECSIKKRKIEKQNSCKVSPL